MPVQGLVRLRKHLFGRQSVMGTAVPATRAYGWTGTPSVERNWTDPEVDVGSIDPVELPFVGTEEVTWNETTDTLKYNDIPRMLAAIFGGNESPTGGGTAQTWTHEPASLTVDPLDLFTGEFGDDVLTDWYQFRDGVAESIEFTGSEGLGPISASINWRFGNWASTGATDRPVTGTVPTPDLTVAKGDAIVYLKDMLIRIADTEAGLAAGQVSNALHEFTLSIEQEWDLKRWANGDQSFAIDDYGRGERTITFNATWSKVARIVGTTSESDHWMSDEAVMRYVQLVFVSKVLAQSPGTYYGWTVTLPITYRTREEGEIGGNTTVILEGRAHYDPDDTENVFHSVLVCTLEDADLGTIGS
jgi:hypothetical protein